MDRCPKCKRFGIIYDSSIDKERCVWNDCLWVNEDNMDLSKHYYGMNFKKFRESILKKKLSTV